MSRKPATFAPAPPPVPVPVDDAPTELLRIASVMADLDCSRSTVYREIGKGTFDVRYVGADPRITRASVERYKQRQRG